MPINWTKLKNDWKAAMNAPSTSNNKDQVVEQMVNALKEQMDQAQVTGSTTDGATLVPPTTHIL